MTPIWNEYNKRRWYIRCFFGNKPSFQLECEAERERYRNMGEPKINFNYFTYSYEFNDDNSDELPF